MQDSFRSGNLHGLEFLSVGLVGSGSLGSGVEPGLGGSATGEAAIAEGGLAMATRDRFRTMIAGFAGVLVGVLMVGGSASAADLQALTAVSLIGDAAENPRTGEAFSLRFNFINSQMPGCSDYAVRLTVNGRSKTARVPWGCGSGGSWTLIWGVWAETEPGFYPFTVELDPEDEIAETNEANNVFTGFVLVEEWSEPPVLIEWPAAGRFGIGGDMDSQVHMDLLWFQEGEIDTAMGHACAYDGHDAHDIGNRFNFDAMDHGPIAIFAARDGTVTFVQDGLPDRVGDCSLGCGNMIRIDHGGGIETAYCHLQAGGMRVQQGDAVVAGQQIGSMGNSGCSGGVHVHFAVTHNGLPVDPMPGVNNPNPHIRFRSPPEQFAGLTAASDLIVCGQPHERRKYYFYPDDGTIGIAANFGVPQPVGTRLRYEWWFEGSMYVVNDFDPQGHDQCGAEWYWCRWRPAASGEGEVRAFVNGQSAGVLPFQTVPAGFVPPANTPPSGIAVAFREPPAEGVPAWVEVVEPPFDREYDRITYTYEWYLDGALVRSHETLVQSDALPVSVGACGSVLGCVVTVTDGTAMADPVIVEAAVLDAEGLACACGPADLAAPFGTLDLADLVAFVSAFNAGEPAADFAVPFGVFDLSDVVAFVVAFGNGCP